MHTLINLPGHTLFLCAVIAKFFLLLLVTTLPGNSTANEALVLAKRLAVKSISEMTYFVSSGMLNLNSVSQSLVVRQQLMYKVAVTMFELWAVAAVTWLSDLI